MVFKKCYKDVGDGGLMMDVWGLVFEIYDHQLISEVRRKNCKNLFIRPFQAKNMRFYSAVKVALKCL